LNIDFHYDPILVSEMFAVIQPLLVLCVGEGTESGLGPGLIRYSADAVTDGLARDPGVRGAGSGIHRRWRLICLVGQEVGFTGPTVGGYVPSLCEKGSAVTLIEERAAITGDVDTYSE
jgi:hypothetical protein